MTELCLLQGEKVVCRGSGGAHGGEWERLAQQLEQNISILFVPLKN